MNSKKYAIILLGLVLSLLLYPPAVNAEQDISVTVFIIDTEVDFSFVKNLAMTGDISHGSVVGRIIYQEVPAVNLRAYGVQKEGEIQQERYYEALAKVAAYQQEHAQEKIIVNISLGFGQRSVKHQKLINRIVDKGGVVIAAAGNDSAREPVYPAGFEAAVAVGNATKEAKAKSSNFGEFIDLSAPGSVEYISRLYLPQGLGIKSFEAVGTSFSAPRVAALLAKLLILEPDLSLERGLELISNNTDKITDPKYEQGLLGTGVINADRTLAEVDPYYYFKRDLPSWLISLSVLLLFIYYFRDYPFGTLFLIILLILVILPVIFLLQKIFMINLQEIWAYQQYLKWFDYLYLGGVPLIIGIITSWQQKFIVISYCLGLIILILGVQPIIKLGINPIYYLRINLGLIIIFLVVMERIRIYQVINFNNLNQLIPLLTSNSQEIIKLVKDKLKEGDYSLKNLLKQLDKENISVELSKEIVIAKADQIPLIKNLFEILKEVDQLEERIIKLLGKLETDKVVSKLKKELINAKPAVKEKLLRLIAHLKFHDKEIIELIIKILFSQADMWLRYQALLTLTALSSSLEELRAIIEQLKFDHHEIVRLEAKSLEQQLED